MVKPKKQTKRIDGVVATVTALSRLMLMPEQKKSVPVFFLGGGSGAKQQRA
jgi:phage terminase large subunit-like protein